MDPRHYFDNRDRNWELCNHCQQVFPSSQLYNHLYCKFGCFNVPTPNVNIRRLPTQRKRWNQYDNYMRQFQAQYLPNSTNNACSTMNQFNHYLNQYNQAQHLQNYPINPQFVTANNDNQNNKDRKNSTKVRTQRKNKERINKDQTNKKQTDIEMYIPVNHLAAVGPVQQKQVNTYLNTNPNHLLESYLNINLNDNPSNPKPIHESYLQTSSKNRNLEVQPKNISFEQETIMFEGPEELHKLLRNSQIEAQKALTAQIRDVSDQNRHNNALVIQASTAENTTANTIHTPPPQVSEEIVSQSAKSTEDVEYDIRYKCALCGADFEEKKYAMQHKLRHASKSDKAKTRYNKVIFQYKTRKYQVKEENNNEIDDDVIFVPLDDELTEILPRIEGNNNELQQDFLSNFNLLKLSSENDERHHEKNKILPSENKQDEVENKTTETKTIRELPEKPSIKTMTTAEVNHIDIAPENIIDKYESSTRAENENPRKRKEEEDDSNIDRKRPKLQSDHEVSSEDDENDNEKSKKTDKAFLQTQKTKKKKNEDSDSPDEKKSQLESSADTDSVDILQDVKRYLKQILVNRGVKSMDTVKNLIKKIEEIMRRPKINIYKCVKCFIHFIKESKFKKHLNRGNHNHRKKRCVICRLEFSKKSVKEHVQMHHVNMQLKIEDFDIITKLSSSDSDNNISPNSNDATDHNLELQNPEPSTANENQAQEYPNSITTKSSNDNTTEQSTVENYQKEVTTEPKTDNLIVSKVYKCEICEMCFVNQTTWRNHMVYSDHNPKTKRQCEKCCLSFTEMTYRKHINLHHNESTGLHKLEIFTLDSINNEDLEQTELQYETEETDESNVGSTKPLKKSKTIKQKPRKQEFKSKSYSKTIYKCRICKICFLTLNSIKDHIYSDRHNIAKAKSCSVCGLSFFGVTIDRHFDIHHKILGLKNKSDLLIINLPKGRNAGSHHNKDEADDAYSVKKRSQSRFVQEVNVHRSCDPSTGDKEDITTGQFQFYQQQTQTESTQRMKNNSDSVPIAGTSGVDDRSYECLQRDVHFIQKTTLIRHMMATKHNVNKSYTCPTCRCTFSTKRCLQRHVSVQHLKHMASKKETSRNQVLDRSSNDLLNNVEYKECVIQLTDMKSTIVSTTLSNVSNFKQTHSNLTTDERCLTSDVSIGQFSERLQTFCNEHDRNNNENVAQTPNVYIKFKNNQELVRSNVIGESIKINNTKEISQEVFTKFLEYTENKSSQKQEDISNRYNTKEKKVSNTKKSPKVSHNKKEKSINSGNATTNTIIMVPSISQNTENNSLQKQKDKTCRDSYLRAKNISKPKKSQKESLYKKEKTINSGNATTNTIITKPSTSQNTENNSMQKQKDKISHDGYLRAKNKSKTKKMQKTSLNKKEKAITTEISVKRKLPENVQKVRKPDKSTETETQRCLKEKIASNNVLNVEQIHLKMALDEHCLKRDIDNDHISEHPQTQGDEHDGNENENIVQIPSECPELKNAQKLNYNVIGKSININDTKEISQDVFGEFLKYTENNSSQKQEDEINEQNTAMVHNKAEFISKAVFVESYDTLQESNKVDGGNTTPSSAVMERSPSLKDGDIADDVWNIEQIHLNLTSNEHCSMNIDNITEQIETQVNEHEDNDNENVVYISNGHAKFINTQSLEHNVDGANIYQKSTNNEQNNNNIDTTPINNTTNSLNLENSKLDFTLDGNCLRSDDDTGHNDEHVQPLGKENDEDDNENVVQIPNAYTEFKNNQEVKQNAVRNSIDINNTEKITENIAMVFTKANIMSNIEDNETEIPQQESNKVDRGNATLISDHITEHPETLVNEHDDNEDIEHNVVGESIDINSKEEITEEDFVKSFEYTENNSSRKQEDEINSDGSNKQNTEIAEVGNPQQETHLNLTSDEQCFRIDVDEDVVQISSDNDTYEHNGNDNKNVPQLPIAYTKFQNNQKVVQIVVEESVNINITEEDFVEFLNCIEYNENEINSDVRNEQNTAMVEIEEPQQEIHLNLTSGENCLRIDVDHIANHSETLAYEDDDYDNEDSVYITNVNPQFKNNQEVEYSVVGEYIDINSSEEITEEDFVEFPKYTENYSLRKQDEIVIDESNEETTAMVQMVACGIVTKTFDENDNMEVLSNRKTDVRIRMRNSLKGRAAANVASNLESTHLNRTPYEHSLGSDVDIDDTAEHFETEGSVHDENDNENVIKVPTESPETKTTQDIENNAVYGCMDVIKIKDEEDIANNTEITKYHEVIEPIQMGKPEEESIYDGMETFQEKQILSKQTVALNVLNLEQTHLNMTHDQHCLECDLDIYHVPEHPEAVDSVNDNENVVQESNNSPSSKYSEEIENNIVGRFVHEIRIENEEDPKITTTYGEKDYMETKKDNVLTVRTTEVNIEEQNSFKETAASNVVLNFEDLTTDEDCSRSDVDIDNIVKNFKTQDNTVDGGNATPSSNDIEASSESDNMEYTLRVLKTDINTTDTKNSFIETLASNVLNFEDLTTDEDCSRSDVDIDNIVKNFKTQDNKVDGGNATPSSNDIDASSESDNMEYTLRVLKTDINTTETKNSFNETLASNVLNFEDLTTDEDCSRSDVDMDHIIENLKIQGNIVDAGNATPSSFVTEKSSKSDNSETVQEFSNPVLITVRETDISTACQSDDDIDDIAKHLESVGIRHDENDNDNVVQKPNESNEQNINTTETKFFVKKTAASDVVLNFEQTYIDLTTDEDEDCPLCSRHDENDNDNVVQIPNESNEQNTAMIEIEKPQQETHLNLTSDGQCLRTDVDHIAEHPETLVNEHDDYDIEDVVNIPNVYTKFKNTQKLDDNVSIGLEIENKTEEDFTKDINVNTFFVQTRYNFSQFPDDRNKEENEREDEYRSSNSHLFRRRYWSQLPERSYKEDKRIEDEYNRWKWKGEMGAVPEQLRRRYHSQEPDHSDNKYRSQSSAHHGRGWKNRQVQHHPYRNPNYHMNQPSFGRPRYPGNFQPQPWNWPRAPNMYRAAGHPYLPWNGGFF